MDSTVLLVFILQSSSSDEQPCTHDNDALKRPSQAFCAGIAIAECRLRQTVPAYMLPAVFLPVHTLPQMTSFKTDRRCLRECASALSAKGLLYLYSTVPVEKRGLLWNPVCNVWVCCKLGLVRGKGPYQVVIYAVIGLILASTTTLSGNL